MFDQICSAALAAKTLSDLKTAVAGMHIDAIDSKIPFQTAAGSLAARGQHQAVEFLHQLGAKTSNIAQGYALGGYHDYVEKYRQEYSANVHFIAQAYAIARNQVKVNEYVAKHKAHINFIAQGHALAGNHEQVERCVKGFGADTASIVFYYAAAGYDDQVDLYCSHDSSLKAHACGGYSLVDRNRKADSFFDRTISTLRMALMQRSYMGLPVDITNKTSKEAISAIALGCAAAGNHKEVEFLRETFQVNVDEIIEAYASAGYHDKVKEYKTKHGACAIQAIFGYAQSGFHEKVEQYRIEYEVDPRYVVLAYLTAGFYDQTHAYQSKGLVSLDTIDLCFRRLNQPHKYKAYCDQFGISTSVSTGTASQSFFNNSTNQNNDTQKQEDKTLVSDESDLIDGFMSLNLE